MAIVIGPNDIFEYSLVCSYLMYNTLMYSKCYIFISLNYENVKATDDTVTKINNIEHA